MKLILHIGIHKTGTSSLQFFLKEHARLLSKHGVYVPISPTGTKNFNNSAAKLARGKHEEVKKLFSQIKERAQVQNLENIILSAESFYAMTYFFGSAEEKHSAYFDHEELRIKALKTALEIFDQVEVVCYLREGDAFADSLYNQLVKDNFGLSCSYESFLGDCPALFEMNKHLDIYKKIFGDKHVHIYQYEDLDKGIIHHFSKLYLPKALHGAGEGKTYSDNLRLSVSCLAYKRVFNKLSNCRALHLMVKKALLDLCSTRNIDEYISPQDISKFIRAWIRRPDRFFMFQLRKTLNSMMKRNPAMSVLLNPLRRVRSFSKHAIRKVRR